jgi:hypothetical protein
MVGDGGEADVLALKFGESKFEFAEAGLPVGAGLGTS